jgi:hypothetical protein
MLTPEQIDMVFKQFQNDNYANVKDDTQIFFDVLKISEEFKKFLVESMLHGGSPTEVVMGLTIGYALGKVASQTAAVQVEAEEVANARA